MIRFSIFRACYIAAMALAIAAIPNAPRPARAAGEPASACALETFGAGTVQSVRDGRTLALADGREVRLLGLELPAEPGAAAHARQALARLAHGRDVTLKKTSATVDRHGRTVAYLVVKAADGERAAQDALLSAGHAMVAARVGDAGCAQRLQAIERGARDARRGLWALPQLRPLPAGEPEQIVKDSGEFRLVAGKVLSVRESGAVIYVNYGRRWTRDFSVTILKRSQRLFAAAGIEPKQLEGREVLVRGIVERRSGPLMEAVWPEQIEILK